MFPEIHIYSIQTLTDLLLFSYQLFMVSSVARSSARSTANSEARDSSISFSERRLLFSSIDSFR
ncbi:hypothetical protein Hamer_G008726 [Homarus americanus]|uniref:Uncharacterized protein n=1 Tax=Homarus americanus TaxID=6706 RepID=A0A8J5N4I8_HOMAM|nr:hypothetical protein Hamer_G008726 [Homarus americanus]